MIKLSLVVAVIGAARTASAAQQCIYQGSYYEPADLESACTSAEQVPLGCPVYYVVPHDATANISTPHFFRGTQEIHPAYTATVMATVTEQIGTIDRDSCDCAPTTIPMVFDQMALTVTAAREGDGVAFDTPPDATAAVTEFAAAGPCPAAEWPTTFIATTDCDLCPMDPLGSNREGDPPGHGAGCSAGGAVAWPLSLIVLGLRLRRRRR